MCFRFDGQKGLYIHPDIWHEGVFGLAGTQRFFDNPYLWVTTIHPLFGVIRFLQLVAGRPQAESPTQEILRDTPFMMNVVVWVIEVLVIVYRLRPS